LNKTAYFDITSLLEFLKKSPTVTGLERVQVDALLAQEAQYDLASNSACIVFGQDFKWRSVSIKDFCRLFRQSDLAHKSWQAKLSAFAGKVSDRDPVVLASGDVVYFLRASWNTGGYFESLRDLRRGGVRCIFYMHDTIPLKFPEYFTSDAETVFSYWIYNIAIVADAVICNSQATRKDFLALTGFSGPTYVVDLNIRPRFALADEKDTCSNVLADHGLSRGNYVLMVGTIEPRKNHAAIASIWNRLGNRFGDSCPKLVIVGRIGWNAKGICKHIEMMNSSGRIVHLEEIRDCELAQLYRHCFFTVYASRYEGWGLPVTESLAFGKVCVSSDNSSLPEAGRGLTILVEDGNEREFETKLAELVENPVLVRNQEEQIRARASFKTWLSFYRQLRGVEPKLKPISQCFVPVVEPNTSYWFGRGRQPNAFSGSMPGEILRSGPGWLPPADWGIWNNARKSSVVFSVSEDGDFDCYVLVMGPSGGARMILSSRDMILWEGVVVEQKLIWGRLGAVAASEEIRLSIESEPLASPSSGEPTVLVGWSAMQLLPGQGDSAPMIEGHRTLSILRAFLERG